MMQLENYDMKILSFFHQVVLYPGEALASWYKPDCPLFAGKKACWFSYQGVLTAYTRYRQSNTHSAERDLKRVTEILPTKSTRKTAKLCVMKQKIPRDATVIETKKVQRCILIDKEEVLNLTRFILKRPDWQFTEIQTSAAPDQLQQMCSFA